MYDERRTEEYRIPDFQPLPSLTLLNQNGDCQKLLAKESLRFGKNQMEFSLIVMASFPGKDMDRQCRTAISPRNRLAHFYSEKHRCWSSARAGVRCLISEQRIYKWRQSGAG
jgi:hypothetical protein